MGHQTAIKRQGDAAAILALLKTGPQTTAFPCSRWPGSYRQRLSDLRADGWRIECRRGPNGSVFTLLGRNEATQLELVA